MTKSIILAKVVQPFDEIFNAAERSGMLFVEEDRKAPFVKDYGLAPIMLRKWWRKYLIDNKACGAAVIQYRYSVPWGWHRCLYAWAYGPRADEFKAMMMSPFVGARVLGGKAAVTKKLDALQLDGDELADGRALLRNPGVKKFLREEHERVRCTLK